MLTKSFVLQFALVLALATADSCSDETCLKNRNPHVDHALLQAKAKLISMQVQTTGKIAKGLATPMKVYTQKAKATSMRASAEARAKDRRASAKVSKVATEARARARANETKNCHKECNSPQDGCDCPAGQHTCHDPSTGSAWCQEHECPVMCDWDTQTICWIDEANVCKPMEEGCPCNENEHKCFDFMGYSWCEHNDWGDCPVSCDWNTQTTCWDDATQKNFCADMHDGCPCTGNEIKCTTEWSAWCQNPDWGDCPEPPPVCTDTQHKCWNYEAEKEECYEEADGCPCHDPENEETCHDTNNGYAWCQRKEWGDCPVFCENTELSCWEEGGTTNTCHPMADGCPCKANEEKCPDPNFGPWCQEAQSDCPVICDWNTEVHCWDEATSSESCHPEDQGCPGDCADGEITCWNCNYDEPKPQPEPAP